MAKNKLLAFGCSYTEHYEHSMWAMGVDHSFPRWPQLLADKLDMECVNLGRTGMGNEYMTAKLLEALHKYKNVGLIVIMWSEFQRMDFQIATDAWNSLHPHRDNERFEQFPMNMKGRKALLEYNNIVSSTMKSIRLFLIAQELCRSFPYLMIQGCVPVVDAQYLNRPETIDDTEITFLSKDDLDGDIGNSVNFGNPRFPYPKTNFDTVFKIRKKAIQQILKYDIADKINEDKFIGWPIFSEVDGFCVDNILDNLDPLREKYRVSERDSHPNGPGHEVISEEIYKVYKKVYG